MALVFLAVDVQHHRPVAVKVFRPELAAALGAERFLREIEIAARLNHPHILPLHHSGNADGFLYYVMPYVDGESLRQRLMREQQLPLDDALEIAREVADALAHAHSRGVVHRDIKPENILLQSGHAVVADFGIARAVSAAGGDRLTSTGISVGTPGYMSPEQAAGDPQLDGRSDLYSLGCVLYEMLAGHPPFMGRSAQAVLARHTLDPVPSLRTVRATVPEAVERAILKALAKVPADRFATAAQFAAALERRESAAPSTAGPASRAERSRWARRLTLLGLVAVVVIGGALLASRSGRVALAPAGPVYEHRAVAVLPFQNLSPDGPHAYFAGGLHEELLTQLAKVAALKVISRTSVMGYEATRPPLRQIASELRVGSVVEGSVQVVGRRLRVNIQLIDAATDTHLWAERYDRTLNDAFAIESDVARQVAAAVGAALSDAERHGLADAPTANAEAYRLYLQGHEYWTRPGDLRPNLEAAEQLYERAIALDRGFALAHAALSHVHFVIYWARYDPSPARAARQRQEAEAALRLAPDLPEAHIGMGLSHYLRHTDYQLALREFQVALKGRPNDAELWGWIGAVQRRLGNWDDVLVAYAKATQLNPRDALLFLDKGGESFLALHRYAEALNAFDRALTLAPDLHEAAIERGWAYLLWQGQLDSLRAVIGRLPSDADLGAGGSRAEWQVRLAYWARQPDSVLAVLRRARFTVFESRSRFFPRSLYAAWAHQQRGDPVAARAAFDSARVLLDSVMRELPDDWRVHAARGLALAALGRRDEARREASWLERSVWYRKDAFLGPVLAENRAGILAQVGDADAAMDAVERLVTKPSWFSVSMLRLDPIWEPLRQHPRLRALGARHGAR